MAWLVECLLYEKGDLSSDSEESVHKSQALVVLAHNARIEETEM